MNPSPTPFRVAFSGAVGDELRRLVDRAIAQGVRGRLADAMKVIRTALRTDPLGWGDPTHDLRALGLVVFRRIFDELLVSYAVNEGQRVVWLTGIQPVLGHPLCQPDSGTG
jgi:hypothetical protein